MNTEEKKVLTKCIWELENKIEELNTKSIEYKALYDKTLKEIEEKKDRLKILQKMIGNESKSNEKSVKDILQDLIDEENSRYYLIDKLERIYKDKLSEEDKTNLDDAINYLRRNK